MTEKFVASNGIPVIEKDWGLSFTQGVDLGTLTGVSEDQANALREFFQHERDRELGRWRWPEKPDYVVYQKQTSVTEPTPGVRVVHEVTGRSRDVGREAEGACDATLSNFGHAAVAYFAAHPEPKPWMEVPDGVYAVSAQVHPHERLLQKRDGKWLHLYRSDRMSPVEVMSAESVAKIALNEKRLTRLTPEAPNV